MSHFGRSGPPDIRDTYSLLVLNITFRTTADDLFPLFDKYGKVVDVFIPRDRRTGDSRGFAFVRYKYADEAQKAVDKLDGRVVDGREIMVQFAKYGPDAEKIHKGRIIEPVEKFKRGSRSRSPRPSSRYRDDYRDKDYRRRNRSRSRDRSDYERHQGRDRDRDRDRDRYRSRSRSRSPDYRKERRRGRYDDKDRSRSPYRSISPPVSRSVSPRKSMSPRKTTSRSRSPAARVEKDRSPTPKSVSPGGRPDSRSLSPQRSDADE
ncbi:hypothetical protein QVD17_07597 [Tagetes erecta]|uniref:RRM domain-containing protein n=1 Tax=Tagetes erecta TaxID=13708 RepID=A0AAD8PC38_TARER|nr:hypothetical protein QVD17_07597 [Tagetes erecta]